MRTLTVGLTGLFIALGSAASAVAQTTPAAPAMAAKPSVDKTTIGALLANPAAKAVIDKDLPGLSADSRIDQAKDMTLKDIEPYSEGKIDDAKLATVQKDLDAIPAP